MIYLHIWPGEMHGGEKMKRTKADLPLTLHDLLELHLQGLDGAGWIVSGRALYPVDGQTAIHHGSHIVVLQEDHAVRVLDHCAVVARNYIKHLIIHR